MPEKQVPKRDQLGRPSTRDTVARARAAAGPAAAKASAAAGPALEKAAGTAGKLLGTLRMRAQETVKEFTDAYGKDEPRSDAPAGSEHDAGEQPPKRRPRPS